MNIEKKYTMGLIPLKNYKKNLVFLAAEKLDDIINYSRKARKHIFARTLSFKFNVSLYSNGLQSSGAINVFNDFASPVNWKGKILFQKQDKGKPYFINRGSNSSSA